MTTSNSSICTWSCTSWKPKDISTVSTPRDPLRHPNLLLMTCVTTFPLTFYPPIACPKDRQGFCHCHTWEDSPNTTTLVTEWLSWGPKRQVWSQASTTLKWWLTSLRRCTNTITTSLRSSMSIGVRSWIRGRRAAGTRKWAISVRPTTLRWRSTSRSDL